MLRSRIGLGLVLACLVFSLTACGGGDDESMTPPMPDSGGGDEPTTPPTPTTQTCLDGSTVSANQTCPTPTDEDVSRAFGAAQVVGLDRAASALPTFGSVSQGSNVQDGMTTDSVSIAYIPHGDTFHPIATIRTGDGTVLKSHEDPTRLDVELPSGQIIQVDPASDWEADLAQHYTPEDWRIAEEEVFKELVDQYGEAEGRTMFIQQYGSYPIGDDVPYTRESRPVTYGLFSTNQRSMTYLSTVSPRICGIRKRAELFIAFTRPAPWTIQSRGQITTARCRQPGTLTIHRPLPPETMIIYRGAIGSTTRLPRLHWI